MILGITYRCLRTLISNWRSYHGFRGYPEVASPYPTDQPGMVPPRMPIPMPADSHETLQKWSIIGPNSL